MSSVRSASVIAPEEAAFAVVGADLLAMAGADYPVRHVISIKVERVSRIWAPSYRLFPDRTEEERMRAVYANYGVTPVEKS